MRLERSVPLGVLLVGAALTALVSGVVTATDEELPTVLATASASPTPSPGPTPTSSSVPTGTAQVLDVATHPDGPVAVLGRSCRAATCATWVRWSGRGVAGLRRAPLRVVLSGLLDSAHPTRLALGGADRAWLWSSGRTGGAVWWTSDAGRTWTSTTGADYRAVASGPQDTWLLRSTCATSCASRLVSVSTGPDLATGRRLELPDDTGDVLSLRRTGSGGAFLLLGRRGADVRLWVATDDAASWQRATLPDPCGTENLALEVLPSDVWLDCQSRPAQAGDPAPAALWRSTDRGTTWQRLPQPPAFRSSALLTLLTSQRALMTDGSAGVYETTDAGRTWSEALPFQEQGWAQVRQAADGTLVTAPLGSRAELRVRAPGAATWSTLLLP